MGVLVNVPLHVCAMRSAFARLQSISPVTFEGVRLSLLGGL